MANRKIIFPQSPMVDLQTGYLALEWFMWFQNPQFLSIVLGTPIDVVNGGTGLTSGTSGGILGFTGSTTLASSVALTQHAIVIGGGAGATPTPLGSLGTTTTVLHGNASGDPTFGSVSLTADITGTLLANHGGTGFASYAVGDLLYADTTTTLAKLADVATGNALISGGVTTAPSWGKIGLTTHVSGTLGVGNGGTGNASLAALTKSDDTNVTLTLGGSPSTALVNAASITAGWTGTLAVSRGGTGVGTLTGIPLGSGTSAFTALEYVDWTTPAFNAADFTGNGSMTWTVDAGDVVTLAYTINGKTMTVAYVISATTVGGTLNNTLQIKIPAGKTATKLMVQTMGVLADNNVIIQGFTFTTAGGTLINIQRSDAANFAAATNATSCSGLITFQIN